MKYYDIKLIYIYRQFLINILNICISLMNINLYFMYKIYYIYIYSF